jgi:type I restriction enzyme M protein
LEWKRWAERTKDENWIDTYNQGWKKLKRLRAKKGEDRFFSFDVLMANPPFAGDIKQGDLLALYELGHKANGKPESKVGRDLLFIERNLDFLRPGGRMAIVLPQGRLKNSSDKRVREFVAEHCRILAVVGLHPNTFKPHTGTKTSVLFVQKWNDDPDAGPLCPRIDDYSIFFATQQKPGKNTSGDKIYERVGPEDSRTKETPNYHDAGVYASRDYLTDEHGHWIVEHDLFNYEGLTRDGIAEAFEQFAIKEGLSFF